MQQEHRMIHCPVCHDQLVSKILHGQQIDECQNQHGFWVDDGELTAMLRAIQTIPEPSVPLPNAAGASLQQRFQTEAICCPNCATKILPSVYAYDSGIIVHRCDQCRGSWISDEKLSEIAMYQKASPMVNSLAVEIGNRYENEHRGRVLSAALRSKRISGVWAVACVLLATVFGRSELALPIFGAAASACMLIWFGDYFGSMVNYRGYFAGISRRKITAQTPGIFIVLFGWLLLLAVSVVVARS